MDHNLAIIYENTVKIKLNLCLGFKQGRIEDSKKNSKKLTILFMLTRSIPNSLKALKRPCSVQVFCAAVKNLKKKITGQQGHF